MDITTIIGVIAGIGLVFGAILLGGNIAIFISIPSLMITVGGTLAATLISYNINQVFNVTKVLGRAFQKETHTAEKIIAATVKFAERARIQGILSLEEEAEHAPDPFLRKGLELIIDGTDPAMVRDILETEIDALQERHRAGKNVFESMALYSPSFGMIGTLIGLVQMLLNLRDPSKIGPGLAVAIITTFYGALGAYLVFYPIARKLDVKSKEEVTLRILMVEGLLSIQAGNNPRLVAKRLKAFLPPTSQEGLEEKIFAKREEGAGMFEDSMAPSFSEE